MAIYDAIIIGAGHNGLTTACYLAKAGLNVLVLEQYHLIGGMTITEEITLPGFHSDIHASGYQLTNLSPVPEELGLEKLGVKIIKPEFPFSHAFPNGKAISVHRDVEKTAQNIAQYSLRDADTWRQLMQQYREERAHLIKSLFSPPLSLVAKANNYASTPQGMDAYRFSMQSLRSWANQMFDAEETKSLFASFASFLGASPDDACGAELAWLFASVLQNEGNHLVQGGMNQVTLALAKYLKDKGGSIRTSAKVSKIIVKNARATEVQLENGEVIAAGKIIASSIDPQQLVLQLLGEETVGEDISTKIKNYEWGDSVFVMYTALNNPVNYKAGHEAEHSAHVHLMPSSIDALSQVYLECRGGKLPAQPLIVSWNDGTIDPTRVPAGKSLMKFVILNVPYKLKNKKNWEQIKEQYADHLIDLITTNYIPHLRESILKRVALSPIDLEKKIISAVQGTLGQGAFLPYQSAALRPIPELGEYKTPIKNVYLCGSSSHPGPGVSMGPGYNAAHIIAKDLGLKF